MKPTENVALFLLAILFFFVGCFEDHASENTEINPKTDATAETQVKIIALPAEIPEGLSLIQPRKISATSAQTGHLPVNVIDNNPRSFWAAEKKDASPTITFSYLTNKARKPLSATGAMVQSACGPSGDFQAAQTIRIVKKATPNQENTKDPKPLPDRVFWETTLETQPSAEAQFFVFDSALPIDWKPGVPVDITAEVRGKPTDKDNRPVCLADLVLFSGKVAQP